MGLVKALQGAPESFSGYTKALGKKEERDFLAAQSELAHKRNMSMENLRAEKQMEREKFSQGAQDKRLTQQLDAGAEQNRLSRLHDINKLTQEYGLKSKAVEDAKDANSKFFETKRQSFIDAGMNVALVDIMGVNARQGHDIGSMVTAWQKSQSSGGIKGADIIKARRDAAEMGAKFQESLQNDPQAEERYILIKNQYPEGTPAAQVFESEYLNSLGLGKYANVQRLTPLKDIKDPAVINSTISNIKRMVRAGQELKSIDQAEQYIDVRFSPETAKKLKAGLRGQVDEVGNTASITTSEESGFGITPQFKQAFGYNPNQVTTGWDDDDSGN